MAQEDSRPSVGQLFRVPINRVNLELIPITKGNRQIYQLGRVYIYIYIETLLLTHGYIKVGKEP